ncbi:MAG: NAD(P)H-dependent glycerol-3-phosphate dehydrogenase [Actinomycetota bacterium]
MPSIGFEDVLHVMSSRLVEAMTASGLQVAIIGAGAMGFALALSYDRAGQDVALCGTEFDATTIERLLSSRIHPVLDHHLSEAIGVYSKDAWASALHDADLVVLAVASVGIRSVVTDASAHLSDKAAWVVATKGWDPDTAEPLSKVIASISTLPIVIMVGPSLAAEMTAGTPTALVCASNELEAARRAAEAIGSETLMAFISNDVAGVEVGAALKNVLAIGIGLCDGLAEVKGRSMTNTKAALFSRGLVEMSKLAEAMGGKSDTVLGLSGAGDLFVTVLGGRNGRFGRLVGTGLDPGKAFAEMGTTVEGFDNAREAYVLAKKHVLDLPVVNMVYSVLHEGVSAEEAISALVANPVQHET